MRHHKSPAVFRVASLIAAITLAVPFGSTAAEQTAKPPMKMDDPMPGEMKKPGMKKGDVKKAADDKQQKMKPMMDKEESAMPAAAAAKK